VVILFYTDGRKIIMRLKKIWISCDKYSDNLEIKGEMKNANGIEYFVASNMLEIQNALDELYEIDFLKAYIDNIYQVAEVLLVRQPIARLSRDQYNGFRDGVNILKSKITTISEFCDSIGYKETEVGFDVKLPEESDFEQFSKNISDFETVIHQWPFFMNYDAVIKVGKVDVGSTWIDFCITGTQALGLLGGVAMLVKKAILIMYKYKECKIKEEEYRSLELSNDHTKAINEAHEKLLNSFVNQCISDISKESGHEVKPEEVDRAKMCFDRIIKLLEMGLEIHPSIESGEDKGSKSLPDTKEWKKIAEKGSQKLLEITEE
jgi:hypothetical protein